ncbi:hypothetical protein C2845_PM14G17620 [Panicum miliaceum]|uniref:Uncharacterized protein n=1 Tax=Panicum miliaceum TaxID=4540 RepID=A0A3L6PPN3_PANMI|nr:hypothetical protein C2845_PM14G17620 [Panicum miliaceum]
MAGGTSKTTRFAGGSVPAAEATALKILRHRCLSGEPRVDDSPAPASLTRTPHDSERAVGEPSRFVHHPGAAARQGIRFPRRPPLGVTRASPGIIRRSPWPRRVNGRPPGVVWRGLCARGPGNNCLRAEQRPAVGRGWRRRRAPTPLDGKYDRQAPPRPARARGRPRDPSPGGASRGGGARASSTGRRRAGRAVPCRVARPVSVGRRGPRLEWRVGAGCRSIGQPRGARGRHGVDDARPRAAPVSLDPAVTATGGGLWWGARTSGSDQSPDQIARRGARPLPMARGAGPARHSAAATRRAGGPRESWRVSRARAVDSGGEPCPARPVRQIRWWAAGGCAGASRSGQSVVYARRAGGGGSTRDGDGRVDRRLGRRGQSQT